MKLQKLFSNSKRWTKGAEARSKTGRSVDPKSRQAVCWCLSGAITKCYSNWSERIRVFAKVASFMRAGVMYAPYFIANFNDRPQTTIAQIRKIVKRANV